MTYIPSSGSGDGVPTTRTLTTTAPLTGGGDLSANRTLTVSDASTTAKGVVELATDGETGAGVVVQGNDSRLGNARNPNAHATSHKSGGTDAIKLDELAAPTDVTTLNASTSAHGLLPKLGGGTTNFLRADGAWATPPDTTGAPVGASYVTLGTDGTLTSERVLTAGSGVTLTDAGAGSTVTVASKALAVRASSNTALAASTTVNLTALDITVASGDVWVLDYVIPVTVSAGTAGLKAIFTLPASSSGTMDVSGTVASVTGYSFTHSTTPTSAAAVAFMTASFTGYIYIRAGLTMGGAGTLRIGFTTGASAAGNLLAGASVIGSKI